MLKQVDEAVAEGFSQAWVCSMWGVADDRVHRWRRRLATTGTLIDRAPGGSPTHGLLDWETAAILELAETWGEVDRSHRKLAHRGSYAETVWVSPSTVRRVLAAHGLVLPEPGSREPVGRRPWPDWLTWAPNRIWGWDVTHFTRTRRCAFAIIDMVSRKWIDTLVSEEEEWGWPVPLGTAAPVPFRRSFCTENARTGRAGENVPLAPFNVQL